MEVCLVLFSVRCGQVMWFYQLQLENLSWNLVWIKRLRFILWFGIPKSLQSLPRLTQFENPTTPTKTLLHTNTTSWNTYEVRTHCIINEEAGAKLRAGLHSPRMLCNFRTEPHCEIWNQVPEQYDTTEDSSLYSKFNAHSLSKFRPKQKQIMIWKASFQDSAQKCPRLACSQHQPPSQGSSPCPSALSPGSCTLQSCLGMTSPQRCYHI